MNGRDPASLSRDPNACPGYNQGVLAALKEIRQDRRWQKGFNDSLDGGVNPKNEDPYYRQGVRDHQRGDDAIGSMHDDSGDLLTFVAAAAYTTGLAAAGIAAVAARINAAAAGAGLAFARLVHWPGNLFGAEASAVPEAAGANAQRTAPAVQTAVANAQTAVRQVTLTQKQLAAIRRIDNAIRDHLQPKDISGFLHDLMGNPIPRKGGGHYQHLQEMSNLLRGLIRRARDLDGVNHPAAQAARERALDAINRIDNAISRLSFEKSH